MIFTLPAAGSAPFIHFIDNARGYLYVNVYYENAFHRQIAAAVARGVRVVVMIEPKPYRMSHRLVEKEIARLTADGALVVHPPSRFVGGYRFDHAKYMVSQGEALIATANFDASALHHNREFGYVTHNPAVAQTLLHVFMADTHEDRPAAVTCAATTAIGVTVSPALDQRCNGKQVIMGLLHRPGPVAIESEEIPRDSPALAAIEAKGVQAQVIVPVPDSHATAAAVAVMLQYHVRVREMPRRPLYMHAKLFITPGAAWFGSDNLSPTSLERNREIGVLLDGPARRADRATLRATFEQDWARASKPGA